MFSSAAILAAPITAMEYIDVGAKTDVEASRLSMSFLQPVQQLPARLAEVQFSMEELAQRLRQERSEASAQTEQRLRQEFKAELEQVRSGIAETISAFEAQRGDYFAQAEAEVVQLALAIAARILHRESQVDPMLIAALVRITIEKLREGSSVTARVSVQRAEEWRQYFANHAKLASVCIMADQELSDGDCVLETEVGTTHFGLDRQLKEVERGFFDLLALRPDRQ